MGYQSNSPKLLPHQAPLSMRFPRQEYWSGLPFPSPGDLSDSGIEPTSPALQADALLSEPVRARRVYVLYFPFEGSVFTTVTVIL